MPTCSPTDDSQLEPNALTVLGVDASQLLAEVLPIAEQPLHWVRYDYIISPAYLPGVSTTSVTLEFTQIDTLPIVQHTLSSVPDDPRYYCELSAVDVPVRLHLRSADGALDEQVDSALEFSGRGVAALAAFIPAAELMGSFAFPLGEDLVEGEFQGLSLGVSLWPGGSRGHVAPEFQSERFRSLRRIPWPPGARSEVASGATPTLLERREFVAVWPRQEVCEGVVYDAADRFLGWSPAQVARDLSQHAVGTLTSAQGSTPVHFSLEPPSGLLCVQGNTPGWPESSFLVQGRLRADAGAVGSALEQLDVSSTFQLVASGPHAASGPQRLQWGRLSFGVQSAAEFAVATGLQPSTDEPQPQFVWFWQGTSTRGGNGTWQTSAEFLVQSAREEAGMVCPGAFDPARGMSPPGPCQTVYSIRLGADVIRASLAQ